MSSNTSRLLSMTLTLCLGVAGLYPSSPSYALTPVEELYAELAKLPDDERRKRLVEGARKEGRVVLINTTSGSQGVRHLAVFTKRYPEIKAERGEINVDRASETIVAETKAGRHISDGLSLSNSDMGEVLKLGIAARYPTPVTKRVLPEYKGALDPEHRWVPYKINEQGMSYNPRMIENLGLVPPKNYMDLCDPQYKGQASFDAPSLRVLAGFNAILGEEGTRKFLECMGKNEPIVIRGLTARTLLMMAGDHAIQGVNTMYSGIALNKKNPAKAPYQPVWSAPVMIYPTSMVINSRAPHPHAAALFVDWNLDDESQEVISGWGRGNVTEKHPFFPPEATLVVFGLVDDAVKDRLYDYWFKYMGAQK